MTRHLLNFRVTPELKKEVDLWLKINPNVSFTDLANASIHEYIRQHHFLYHKPTLDTLGAGEPGSSSNRRDLCVPLSPEQPDVAPKLRYSIECWITAQTNQGICALLLNKINKRNKTETFWQPVTGGIEADETPMDACVREVFEETGLFLQRKELQVLPAPVDVTLASDNRVIRKYVFSAMLQAGRHPIRLSGEHVGFNWTPVSLIKDKLCWQTDKERWDLVSTKLLSSAPKC